MTPLRARLGRVGAGLGPRTGGFLAWWGRSLAAWLPRRWRAALGFDRGRLLLAPAADGTVQLQREDADGLREAGRLAPDDPLGDALADLPRWLLLPAGDGLRRPLVLPAAAGDRLRDVVGFEVDRHTPFGAADVAYDARIAGRRADGRIDVDLVVVPLARLQAARAALGPLAGALAGVDLAGADGTPLGVNLLAPAQRSRIADPWRGWNLGLAALALAALVAGAWQVLDNRRDAADAFEAAFAPKAKQAAAIAAQRRELEAIIAGQAFLDRARAERPTMVEVLDDLTRRVPDGTWLEKVEIGRQRVVLLGLSNEASALVGRLEASPLLASPALTGVLQPDPRSGRDRFSLVAELAPAAAARDTGEPDAPAR